MEEFKELILNKFNDYDEVFKSIFSKIDKLVLQVDKIESNMNQLKEQKTQDIPKELKREILDIDPKIIRNALLFRDYRSILILFKHYYKIKENNVHPYPIQVKGIRKFEYFLNNKWIQDPNAHYIKKTIFMNFQTLFFKINSDVYIDDIEEIVMNQDFILKLDNDTIKRNIFKHINDEIKNVYSLIYK